ncbi:MAG TPA: CHAT domain-containing protein [Chthoniobacterales bacterium]|nr:CHAT domain-containing protein [Chthoniobacterales bacterium]
MGQLVRVPARRLLVLPGEHSLAGYLQSEDYRNLEQPRSKFLSWLGKAKPYEFVLIGEPGAAEYSWLLPHRLWLAGESLLKGHLELEDLIARLHDEAEQRPPFIAITEKDSIVTPAVVVEGDRILHALVDRSFGRGQSRAPSERKHFRGQGRGPSRGHGTGGGPPDNGGSGPTLPEDPEPSATDSVRRTPHIDLSTAEPLPPGTRFTVEVYADKSVARSGETADDIVIDAAPHETEFKIDISILVSESLTVVGSKHGEIIIRRGEDRSTSAEFVLAVNAFAPLEQLATIFAAFSHNFRPGGSVLRRVAIDALIGAESMAQAERDDSPSTIRLEMVRSAPPDLFVDIRPAQLGSDRNFDCCVLSPHLPEFQDASATKPWVFQESTDKVLASKMAYFIKQKTPQALAAALRGAGIAFFEIAPTDFQRAFWQLIDAGKCQTILIATAERYIPWELMVPQRDEKSEPRDALGVEFSVGRWITEKHDPPPRLVHITDSFLIYPNYTDPDRILDAEEEAEFLETNFASRRIDPAVFAMLETYFEDGGASLLHFICHGSSQDADQYLELENDETLNVDQVRGMKGLRVAFQSKKSFVFLNACEVGRQEPALAGSNGFAPCFIRLGASGVIAPLWSIEDTLASGVAVDFYTEALKQPRRPFADIMRSIRARAYGPEGRDTYAAYAFYGDPAAKLADPIENEPAPDLR